MTKSRGPSGPSCAAQTPDALPVLPLRETVVFPLTIAPVSVDREPLRKLVDDATRGNRLIALAAMREGDATSARREDLYAFATAAIVHEALRGPDNVLRVAVQGLARVRIMSWMQTEPYLVARVHWLPDHIEHGTELDALTLTARELFVRFASLVSEPSSDPTASVQRVTDARQLVYLLASTAPMTTEARQQILEQTSVVAKLRQLNENLRHDIAVRQLMHRIANDSSAPRPADPAEKPQAEEGEAALRKELESTLREIDGADHESAETRDLRGSLGKLPLPSDARKEIDRELARLERTPTSSPEHGMIRTYLDWVLKLPWAKVTGGEIDVTLARAVLDRDHYDLRSVKDRITEYLAVRRLRAQRGTPAEGEDGRAREPLLCFVGPPGVGKTSLGQSIARALGRKFARIAFGGIHDEAEIRGHRRTYIGAMPGRILQALARCGAADPVLLLDEVDKLGVGFHGDPAAALLEVLDPAQNHTFVDSYLGVPFDLSRVLMICTANNVDAIPAPLLDRLELLAVTGYTHNEKLHIARRHLLPQALTAHGLLEEEVSFDDDAIGCIVREHTREAGVRNLERAIAGVLRKVARGVSEGQSCPIRVTADTVRTYLGPPRYFDEVAEHADRPGVATGLAWMPSGGDILFVEATILPGGRERLVLTGMMGNVMRESAQAALTYLRANAVRLGLDAGAFDHKTVHVHVPAGSIPKDGPSAGVTILTAIASQAMGSRVRGDLGMTGEITLRGRVLPVGGIKEKVLAAHRAGLRTVVLPRRSEPQLEEVPADVRDALDLVLVESVDEVLAAALEVGETTGTERVAE